MSEQLQSQQSSLSDASAESLPASKPSEDLDEVEPDEIVVRVTEDRAIVFAKPGNSGTSRWGRWLANPTSSELKSLLQHLDPVARAVIEAKRLTGALVELHPADCEMFKNGFKAISEEGGWLQANFRNRGQVARLMRIRPAMGLTLMSGGAFALAAIAAQTQAAAMTGNIEAIGHRVNQFYKHLHDDQIGAAENAVEQVEDLVALLRAHGKEGVSDSDVSVTRDSLGDARSKCIQHLKTAVNNLENAALLPTTHAEKILSKDAVEEVMLYLDLAVRLENATVQFGLAQVALDCHLGRPEVAVSRAKQVTESVTKIRRDRRGLWSAPEAQRRSSRPSPAVVEGRREGNPPEGGRGRGRRRCDRHCARCR